MLAKANVIKVLAIKQPLICKKQYGIKGPKDQEVKYPKKTVLKPSRMMTFDYVSMWCIEYIMEATTTSGFSALIVFRQPFP